MTVAITVVAGRSETEVLGSGRTLGRDSLQVMLYP